MYGLTYLSTYAFEHVHFSETRLYTTFIMGASMDVLMLRFMRHMYNDGRINLGIIGMNILGLQAFVWVG